MRAWVLIEEEGQYSDYTQNVIGVFATDDAAKQFVADVHPDHRPWVQGPDEDLSWMDDEHRARHFEAFPAKRWRYLAEAWHTSDPGEWDRVDISIVPFELQA